MTNLYRLTDRSRRSARAVIAYFCGYWFYALGFLVCEGILLGMFLTMSRHDFVAESRRVGTWGLWITLFYKIVIVAIMVTTRNKTTLDRRFIWHTAALGSVILYAAVLNTWPHILGQLRPAQPLVRQEVTDRLLFAAVVWFNVWGYVCWSALGVLASIWQERGRYVYLNFWRTLRRGAELPMP